MTFGNAFGNTTNITGSDRNTQLKMLESLNINSYRYPELKG
ncbi:MAG: hypothetical protein ACYTXC_19830 [Nostoc sp.]